MVQKLWSKLWKSSTQRRKQRKYVYKAPLNIKHKLLSANLSAELRKEYGVRSVPVRKGDTVRVMAGQFKSQTAKVDSVTLAKTRIYLENVGVKRTDGTQALYPIHPSNVQIIKLDLNDKLRVQKLKSFKSEAKTEKKEVTKK